MMSRLIYQYKCLLIVSSDRVQHWLFGARGGGVPSDPFKSSCHPRPKALIVYLYADYNQKTKV